MAITGIPSADVRIRLQLQVRFARASGKLPHLLRVVRKTGGPVRAHLIYSFYEQSAAFFLCDQASEAALALKQEGFEVDTQTVVAVRTQDRPGLLSFLTQTLEAESIDVGYSYATSTGESVLVVFRTSDNPKAEDVLRNYLLPAEDLGERGSTAV